MAKNKIYPFAVASVRAIGQLAVIAFAEMTADILDGERAALYHELPPADVGNSPLRATARLPY